MDIELRVNKKMDEMYKTLDDIEYYTDIDGYIPFRKRIASLEWVLDSEEKISMIDSIIVDAKELEYEILSLSQSDMKKLKNVLEAERMTYDDILYDIGKLNSIIFIEMTLSEYAQDIISREVPNEWVRYIDEDYYIGDLEQEYTETEDGIVWMG